MMSPLRLAAVPTIATTLALLAGCQSNVTSTQATLAPEPPQNPVFADTGLVVRDYPKSTSYIQNGDTVNDGSTGFRYRSKDGTSVGLAPLAEVGVFAANIATLPYTLYEQRGEQVSTGLQIAPSYTAMPRLPDPPATPRADADVPTGRSGAAPSMGNTEAPAVTPATSAPADIAAVAADQPATVLSRTSTDNNAPSFVIAGQVQRPGTYDIGNLKLSQIVAAAGPSSEDKTKVRVQIDRPGEESAVTTLDQLLSGGVDDIAIKAGDVVTVSVLP